MNPEDHLREYSRTGNEEAFAEVVEAFSSLVYGTAYRKTRNAQMSEEITQNVFILAASKAEKLARQSGIGGWFHRAALFESSNMLKTEATRRKYLQAMNEESKVALEQDKRILSDAIDDALDRLPAADREVILMRFFEGREFEEIGSLLGKSAVATQKKIRRALSKLGLILNRRGLAVSAVTLSAFLTPELAKASPPMIKASVMKSLGSQVLGTTPAIKTTA